MDVLEKDGWQLRGLCHSRRGADPRLVACDLSVDGEAMRQVDAFRPYAVVHAAAEWRPDVLRRNATTSRRLNVDASGMVAAACQRCGAWLVYVSADSVFDGRSPPYSEESTAGPLCEYGWHKLHGEQLTLVACPAAAVLRTSLLYGPCDAPGDSAVTSLLADLASGVAEVDAWQRCYPTWTGDVAQVLAAMLRLHVGGSGSALRGVFHWQGRERLTWHDMLRQVADIAGLDSTGVSAVTSPPTAPLPRDCQLGCTRLEALLGPEVQTARFQTPFARGLRRCLVPLLAPAGLQGGATDGVLDAEAGPYVVEACAASGLQKSQGPSPYPQPGPRAAGGAPPASPAGFGQPRHGAALQDLFWKEFADTRARLKEEDAVATRRTPE